jgi:hypothetical protein
VRVTQRKGDIAVTQAIALFTGLGFDVSLPITESAAYDLVVDVGDTLHRVQVKFTSNGKVDLRRIHSNSSGYVVKLTKENAYDWLFVYHAGQCYVILECLAGRRHVTMKKEYLVSERWPSLADGDGLENRSA